MRRGRSALADQWRRAAMSIPLTIGEGASKTSVAERAHCYAVARGEAMECGAILGVVRLLNAVREADLVRGKQLLSGWSRCSPKAPLRSGTGTSHEHGHGHGLRDRL
jgi:four helix bundle protein